MIPGWPLTASKFYPIPWGEPHEDKVSIFCNPNWVQPQTVDKNRLYNLSLPNPESAWTNKEAGKFAELHNILYRNYLCLIGLRVV